jgi:hypothetical protein
MSFHDFSDIQGGGDDMFNFARQNALTNQTAQTATQPGLFGDGGAFGKGGVASVALGGLQSLGSLWNSFQQQKLAKKSLKFQKDAFKTNLERSAKVYNTALEDRIRSRYATEGRPEEASAVIEERRL